MEVGSLVELIDDNFSPIWRMRIKLPVKGPTYTIREIFVDSKATGEKYVTLEEIENILNPLTWHEYGFLLKRFREILPPVDMEELVEQVNLLQLQK